jgi:hypothetical protein
LKYLIGLAFLLFACNTQALDLNIKPYIFTKTFIGYEQFGTENPYSVGSSLFETGLELPKGFSVSYSYYRAYPEFKDVIEVHSMGVAYKFYKVWE